jgi:septal ring factor EnvC (AmiA/AmiB activator)
MVLQGEKQLQLLNHIRELNKEIEGYRQEIAERDMTIGEKEKRIYDLKKRNQGRFNVLHLPLFCGFCFSICLIHE